MIIASFVIAGLSIVVNAYAVLRSRSIAAKMRKLVDR